MERILQIFYDCSLIARRMIADFHRIFWVHELAGLQFYGTCESRTRSVPDHVDVEARTTRTICVLSGLGMVREDGVSVYAKA